MGAKWPDDTLNQPVIDTKDDTLDKPVIGAEVAG